MYKYKGIKVVIIILIGLQSCAIFNKNNGELVGYNADFETEKDILKRIPKEAKLFFDDMQFIPATTQYIFSNNNMILTAKDTTIVQFLGGYFSSESKVVSTNAFYMSDHEVTNGEYREFVDWVVNYTARELLAQKHPDEYFVEGTKLLKKNKPMRVEQIVLDSMFYLPENYTFSNYYDSYYDTIQTDRLIYKYNYYSVNNVDGKRFLEENTKSIPVYPNTNCWYEEFPSLEGSIGMSQHYFTHPAYNNHPVVGISYEQAQAYCDWRTNQLNEAILLKANVDIGEAYFTLNDFYKHDTISDYSDLLLPPFELPSLAQWQSAAGSNYIDPNAASYVNQKGEYLSNFGKIVDVNNYLIKDYSENNSNDWIFTSPVKSFLVNDFQLYDINGNAAEWTKSTLAYFESFNNYDLNPIPNDSLYDYKIVKGGSWADGPVYLRWRTNTFCDKDRSSSRIGFRVMMPLNYGRSNDKLY